MNKNRALLLDRDGVINIDHGYVGSVARFEFIPGLFPFLRHARDKGYLLAVLTNQSGVARGLYSIEDYNAVTAYMLEGLRKEKIDIDLTLASFEHPEGKVEAHRRASFWRKPNPGMVLEVIQRLDLDPSRSIFLGDDLRDMQAAQNGGIQRCLWLTQKPVECPVGVKIIKDYEEALKNL